MDPEQRAAVLDTGGTPAASPGDVESPESVVAALYDVISGPAEADRERDWDRLRSLFLPGARLTLVRWGDAAAGTAQEILRQWDVDAFIEAARGFWRTTAFYEREVHGRVERFGNIAHGFSTYESRAGSPTGDPVGRGVNSIQFVKDADRWWIASLAWDVEQAGNPIPAELLPPGG